MKRAVLLLTLLLFLVGCQAKVEEPSPKVQTDWSKLEAREPFTPIGSRWYADYTDQLIPSGDYGTLIPYAGARLSDDWFVENGCLYGLMTTDGVAVTDPVFPAIYRPSFRTGASGSPIYQTHPLLVLVRGGEGGERRLAVAAADGSWCTDFSYLLWTSDKDGLLLFSEDGMVLIASDGASTESYSWTDMGLPTDGAWDFLRNLVVSGFVGWYGDYIALGAEDDWETLRCFRRSDRQWEKFSIQELEQIQLQALGEGCELYQRGEETIVIRDGVTWSIPHAIGGSADVYGDLLLFWDDGALYTLAGEEVLAPLEDGYSEFIRDSIFDEFDDAAPGVLVYRYDRQSGQDHYYRSDGTPLPFLDGYSTYGTRQMGLTGGLIHVLDTSTASYYDYRTLECVFRTSLQFADD